MLLLTLERQVAVERKADWGGGGRCEETGKGCCEGTPALGRAGVGPEESVWGLFIVPFCPHLGPIRFGRIVTRKW